MHNIKENDIKTRIITEHYFTCPACNDEISDLVDLNFTGAIECPHCGYELYFEEE